MKIDHILLGHGSGGKLSHDLINQLFYKLFRNPILETKGDAAILSIDPNQIAFTTDSFVVSPLFFPGGDIGKLAVAGTVNDLAVSGASPKFLSAGFIIEEGLPFKVLEKIVISMAEEAKKAGVFIVTGDTKVVGKGQCDQLFINTSGIGICHEEASQLTVGSQIQSGDVILINGSIGDHGMAIMSERNQLNIKASISSDCTCLNELTEIALKIGGIRFMRDATRGGLGTVVTEMVENKAFGINLDESQIPVKENVRGMCELLGFDPLYVANEGKLVLVVNQQKAQAVLEAFRNHNLGKEASIIGQITNQHPGRVWMQTVAGGNRIVDMMAGEQLPRIC